MAGKWCNGSKLKPLAFLNVLQSVWINRINSLPSGVSQLPGNYIDMRSWT